MRIFLSYAHKNRHLAEQLKEVLESGGHTVWIDDLLRVGQDWRQTLEAEIIRAEAIALALSPEWIASPTCQWEFVTSSEHHKKVIPALLKKADLPPRISRFQYQDFRGGFTPEKVEKFLEDVFSLAQDMTPESSAGMDKTYYAREMDQEMAEYRAHQTQVGNIKISAPITGANVVIGSTQTVYGNLTINMGDLAAPSDDRQELAALVEALNAALKQIPEDDAVVIEDLAQQALDEAAKQTPNRRLLEIKGENLKKAAENILTVAPIVAKIVRKLLMLG